jgi:hypothetical protein
MIIGIVTTSDLPEPDVDEPLLQAALTEAGLTWRMVPWDNPGDVRNHLLVLRSPWDYPWHRNAFLNWLDEAAQVAKILNPPSTIRWNHHKGYLRDLAANGFAVVPTQFCTASEALPPAWDLGAERVVIKPCVSAGSWMTRAFGREDPAGFAFAAEIQALSAQGLCGDLMVQPYLESIHTVGERSLIWIDGELTHAIVKSPRFADDHEAVSEAVEPTEDERALVARLMMGYAECLYARVDLMQDSAGVWCISELELIEPSLFLKQNPAALNRLVKGICARMT